MSGGVRKAVGPPKRIPFIHNGQVIYEWEQTMEEVLIHVKPPQGVTSRMIDCTIAANRLTLGIKGNPPFLSEATFGTVVVDESFWQFDSETGELEINLQKMQKAATWASALRGHGELDTLAQSEVQKQMTLERFQEEHPGFDFSNAEFNGMAPDPRKFLGGVGYK